MGTAFAPSADGVIVPLKFWVTDGLGAISMIFSDFSHADSKSPSRASSHYVNRLPIETLIDYFTDYPRYNEDAKNSETDDLPCQRLPEKRSFGFLSGKNSGSWISL